MNKLSDLKQKVGQLFCLGLEGETLSAADKNFLTSYNIGGVILFSRNLSSPRQIYDLCSQLLDLQQSLPEKTPFFIGIDMEGGRVHRLKEPFTKWSPLASIGRLGQARLASEWTYSMGKELQAIGINLNFAPCLDVLSNKKNVLIGDRSLSSDPEEVSRLACHLIKGYQKAGLICCAKHFPGHGNTIIDSHEDLPIEETPLEALKNQELKPFRSVFKASLDLDMLMTAHIQFSKIDKDWPVTFSSFFLKDLLRKELKYKGVLVSDDLEMGALTQHYEPDFIPIQALKSGCDLLIYKSQSKGRIALESVLKALFKDKTITRGAILESEHRVRVLKKKRLKNTKRPSFKDAMKIVGCKKHLLLVKKVENQIFSME